MQRISNRLLKRPPAQMQCPTYDRTRLVTGILHLGVGNFHRAHQALFIDDLIELHGCYDWGICGVGILPQDIGMHHTLYHQDCLYTLVEKSDVMTNARIIGAIKKYIYGYDYPETVFNKLADPAIHIVTITATEAGYYIQPDTNELDLLAAPIQFDYAHPKTPQTIYAYLAEGLARRRQAGIAPFSVLSCDNLSGNGNLTKKALLTYCDQYNPSLAKWIEQNVSFPNCMVDRITLVTTAVERNIVQENYQLNDLYPVVAEPFKQWIIEDNFCNGRPPLEQVGVQFTQDVSLYEKMKIRLLNASHSAMGYLGYLCGYQYIYEIAKTPAFMTYLTNLMDIEVTPLIGNVPGLDLTLYKKILIERFTNESIKDQTLRICMNGSTKIPTFILPSIIEQLACDGPITRLTLCVASWIRFLSGTDEAGNLIPLHDPQAERLSELAKLSLINPHPILACTDIFSDLGKSTRFVNELTQLLQTLSAHGARATLHKIM